MPRPARAQGLSRRHRFTAQGSFGGALRGSRKLRGELCVLHVVVRRGAPSRLGIALTRRVIPEATDRSRIKRIVREAFRRHAVKHAGFDCVLAVKRAIGASEDTFVKEVGALFDQLCAQAAA
jgi:ribonuclease P protein component